MGVEPESSPAAAPFGYGLSAAPWRWSSPDVSEPLPCGSRNASASLALFPDGPPCDRECKSPRPAEWRFSLLPLQAVLASSPLSATPLQTVSSGGGVCPPDTARHACGSPPDSLRSRCPDRTPRSFVLCHICARPCAESFP